MIQRMTLALLIVVLALSTAACGTDEQGAQLAAVPTRSVQATSDPAAQPIATNDAYTIVSLRDPLAAFLVEAEDGEILEQGVTFADVMRAQGQGCFDAGTQAGDPFGAVNDMTRIRWPVLDLAPWRAALDAFPEDALIAQVGAALDVAVQALPLEGTLTVCLLPLPDRESLGTTQVSHLRALLPLNAFAVNRTTLFVGCTGGAVCLDTVAEEIARAYAYAAQYRMNGTAFGMLTMNEWTIYEGRAEAFALNLYPDTVFPWTDTYDVQGEQRLYEVTVRMAQPDVMQTASAGRMYNGVSSATAWAGPVLGARMVERYRAEHPGLGFEALAALPPSEFWEAGEALWGAK